MRMACPPARYLLERGQLQLYSCWQESKQLFSLQQAFNLMVGAIYNSLNCGLKAGQ